MNFPLPASKEMILEALDDIRRGVESGDTLEGFIEFSMAYPDPCGTCGGSGRIHPGGIPCPGCRGDGQGPVRSQPFEMLTRYRIGNLDGQGGLRSFGAMENPHGV